MQTPIDLIAVFNDIKQGLQGNTAAVLLTEEPLSEKRMRQMAADFNQPATTFLSPTEHEDTYRVRWFAPDDEIQLCGHGSLVAMAFLYRHEKLGKVHLRYNHGTITAYRNEDDTISIQLAAIPTRKMEQPPQALLDGLGIPVKEYYPTDNKYIVVVESEADLKNMQPDFTRLRDSEVFGYAVTAPGDTVDFVSRTLVPHVGQLEDHATGSSHAALAPFWSKRLDKTEMEALQLSPRGGRFHCKVDGDEVTLTGNYTFIVEGHLLT